MQVREKIFADFYSTKTGLTTGGMGLGLAIVKRSLAALGGEILILDPPDGGADFRVRLPLGTPAAAASSRSTSAAATA
jgi:signal transduction histidine kinase